MKDQVEECEKIVLQEAMRDQMNGVGRVFISSLLDMGYSGDVISSSLKRLMTRYRVVIVGSIIKIYFENRGLK